MSRMRWYIIQTQNSWFYSVWIRVVMAAAIINSVWTPLTISFDYAIELSQNPGHFMYWVDFSANLIFIADIFVHFFASYQDQHLGAEIFDQKQIASHYLKNEFAFDFISSLQLKSIASWFGNTSGLLTDLGDMVQLLKAFRIKKILKNIQTSNLKRHLKAKLTIFFWLMIIVLYTHIFACLIWWILKTDTLWVTPVEMGSFSLRLYFQSEVSMATNQQQLIVDQFWFQYFSSYYYSTLAFVMADIAPRS